MPIRLHLLLLIISNIAALISGFMLGMSIYEAIRSSLPEIMQAKEASFVLFGMLPAGMGMLLSRSVFRYLITARCPKCGGRAIYHPSHFKKAMFGGKSKVPITYHCRACGHVHRTRVSVADPLLPD